MANRSNYTLSEKSAYFNPSKTFLLITDILGYGYKVFKNDHLIIAKVAKQIQWIYTDENLIEGSKYITNGKVINKSLQNQFNKIVDKILNII